MLNPPCAIALTFPHHLSHSRVGRILQRIDSQAPARQFVHRGQREQKGSLHSLFVPELQANSISLLLTGCWGHPEEEFSGTHTSRSMQFAAFCRLWWRQSRCFFLVDRPNVGKSWQKNVAGCVALQFRAQFFNTLPDENSYRNRKSTLLDKFVSQMGHFPEMGQ